VLILVSSEPGGSSPQILVIIGNKRLVLRFWKRMHRPHKTTPVSGWSRSRNGSEERPNTCGHRHGDRTPERDAYRADRHSRATRARGQPSEKREEHQRS
jgi:hypothetical protein